MKNIYSIYKPVGKTPFQVVQKMKEIYPELQKFKIGYAGRLDPMAEGVLLLLVGDKNKSKHSFEELKKIYTFKAVLGVETDTYDLLGKITAYDDKLLNITVDSLIQTISTIQGTYLQKYPPYSSIRVNGKPLFYWARENKLENIVVPTKEITIYSVKNIQLATIQSKLFQQLIYERINLVDGNFRQKEIIKSWEYFFKTSTRESFQVIEGTMYCSSGTYVRSFVHTLGQVLQTKAVTFSIKRNAVGTYKVEKALDIFKESKE